MEALELHNLMGNSMTTMVGAEARHEVVVRMHMTITPSATTRTRMQIFAWCDCIMDCAAR